MIKAFQRQFEWRFVSQHYFAAQPAGCTKILRKCARLGELYVLPTPCAPQAFGTSATILESPKNGSCQADDFCKFWLRQPSLFWQNFLGGFLRTLSLKFHPKISPATAADTAPRLVLRQNLQKSSRNLGAALCHPPATWGISIRNFRIPREF